MKALKIILIALVVIVGLVLAVAAFLPDNVKLESSIVIKTQENVVFNQVNNLNNWDKWSPFTADDMTHEYSGSEYGIGAINKWESAEMGSGEMEIIESVPFSSIATSIKFMEAGEDQGKANGSWLFEKTEEGIKVTWGIHMTDFRYPDGRLFGLMAGSIMQPQFDKGLNKLKEVCEGMDDYSGIVVEEMTEVPSFSVIDSCAMEDISMVMGIGYGKIMGYMMKNGIEMTGVPFAVYHKWNPEGYSLIEAGIPGDNTLGGKGDVIASSIKAGRYVKHVHLGSYDNLFETHNLIAKYISDCGFTMGGAPFEEYHNDPTSVDDLSQLKTIVCYPIL